MSDPKEMPLWTVLLNPIAMPEIAFVTVLFFPNANTDAPLVLLEYPQLIILEPLRVLSEPILNRFIPVALVLLPKT